MTRLAMIAALVSALAAPAFAAGPVLDVTVSDRRAPAPVAGDIHSERALAIFAQLAAE